MKLRIFFLTLLLVLGIAPLASASTMEVDVEPGRMLDMETEIIHDHQDLRLVGNFGINNQTLLNFSYAIDSEIVGFGGRYELKRGTALFYDYFLGNEADTLELGIRDTTNLVDNLNLIGELKYTNIHFKNSKRDQSDPTSALAYTLQVQERVSRYWAGNIDLIYRYTSGESEFAVAFGTDLYFRNARFYFNYQIEGHSDENVLLAGVEFAF